MANAVQIVITLNNSAAIPPLDELNSKLNTVGIQGQASLKKVADGMNAIGPPALRWNNAMQQVQNHAATSLDSVRLLSQEFGLRLPRAMEAMLSRVPAVTSALSSVLSGVVAIAAVEVFVRVAEEAVQFYNKLFDVNAAMREYLGNAGKAASQKLFDEASLETSVGLLRQANDQVSQLEKKRKAVGADQEGGGFFQYFRQFTPIEGLSADDAGKVLAQGNAPTYSKKDGERQAKAAADAALAQARSQQIQQEQQMQQLRDRLAAQAEAAPAGARAAIERRNALQIAAQERDNQRAKEEAQQRIEQTTRAQQLAYGMKQDDPKLTQVHQLDPNAGAEEQRIKDLKADEDYQAKATVLGRETSLALMKADDERIQASLSGEALLQRKRLDDIRELTLQYRNEGKTQQELAARVAAINQKYAGDESERLVKRQNETAQSVARTQLGGLTGAARAYGERDLRVGQINTDANLAANPDAASAERLAAATELNQKLKDLDESFTNNAKELIAQRTADQLGAFARIDAEAQKSADAQRKAYDTTYRDAAGRDTATVQQHQLLVNALAAIDADAASKKHQLAAQNAAEDLQYDQQAARAEARVREQGAFGWVSVYKNGIVEIEAAEAERIAKLQADASKEGLTADEVARRKTDISREANAEIAQQNQQLQHQIAGNLQAAFTDPIAFIKSRMEQMFFEIVAAWIMRMQVFKSLFGNTMSSLQPGAAGAGQSGSASTAGGLLGQAMHAATGLAAPQSATGAATGVPNIPGTRGITSGHPDISSIYGNIPASPTTVVGGGNAPFADNGEDGGYAGYLTGATDDMSLAVSDANGINGQAAQQAAAQQAGMAANLPSSLSQLGQVAGVGMAGYDLEQSTVGAFESDNPLKGALGDAAAGATIGSLAGPEGALIGAGAGAALGAAAGIAGYITGMGGNMAARSYYQQQIFPQLQADYAGAGNGYFQTEISNANKTASDAMGYMRFHFGASSANWVNDNYMKKELTRVTALIAASAEGGRQFVTLSASQFHTGGDITGFGSFATSPTEGFIHAMLGEKVMNPGASSAHGPMLDMMNSGASATDIASRYLASSSRGFSGGGNTYNGGDLHVHTLDTKTTVGWLKGGGAQLIKKHMNDFNGQYAGDGISG